MKASRHLPSSFNAVFSFPLKASQYSWIDEAIGWVDWFIYLFIYLQHEVNLSRFFGPLARPSGEPPQGGLQP